MNRDPDAICELSKDGRLLIVRRCPLCGKRHTHGAGDPGESEYPALGHRVAHCLNGTGGYHLVLAEGGKEATA